MNTSTSVDWLIDSGCNGHHITPRRDVFRSLRQAKRIKIKTAEKGGELTVEGVGGIDGFIWTAEGQRRVTLYNVVYVPSATTSVLSVERLIQQGMELYFGGHEQWIHCDSTVIPSHKTDHREYSLRMALNAEDGQPTGRGRKQPAIFHIAEGEELPPPAKPAAAAKKGPPLVKPAAPATTNKDAPSTASDKKPPKIRARLLHRRLGHAGNIHAIAKGPQF